jgi:hypothetical protein
LNISENNFDTTHKTVSFPKGTGDVLWTFSEEKLRILRQGAVPRSP